MTDIVVDVLGLSFLALFWARVARFFVSPLLALMMYECCWLAESERERLADVNGWNCQTLISGKQMKK